MNTVCAAVNTPDALYWVYPVSWVLTFAIFIIMYFPTIKRVSAKLNAVPVSVAAEPSVGMPTSSQPLLSDTAEQAQNAENADANTDA